MRTPHWLTPLAICILTLSVGSEARAQYPGMPPAGIQAPGLPPGSYNPYPQISPFEMGYSQTYNKRGLWFNDSVGMMQNGGRNWTINVDWIKSQPRKLKGLVGAPDTTSYLDYVRTTVGVAPTDDVAGDDGFDVFDFFSYFDPANASMIGKLDQNGIRISGESMGPGGSGFLFSLSYNPSTKERYNPKTALARERYDVWDQPGLIGNRRANEDIVEFLLTNPLKLAANISPPYDWALDAPPQTHQNDSTESGLLQRNLYNLHGLPLQTFVENPDADPADPADADFGLFGGFTNPYDVLFTLEHHHESFDVNMGYALAPIPTNGAFTLTPIVSGRYMYIGEEFRFLGIDSGLNYTVGGTPATFKEVSRGDGRDDGDDKIVDNTGASDDGAGGGGGAFIGGNTSATPDTNWSMINPNGLIRSFLNQEVTTHLAGPEIALRYQLGDPRGTGLKIFGQTKVGVMVNRESLNMRGDNIGNLLAFGDGTDGPYDFDAAHLALFDPGDTSVVGSAGGAPLAEVFATDGSDPDGTNRFSDSKSNTHISPLFEQSFQAELPIFSQVPVLNRVRMLDGANFRVGYSFLWIGEVASPNRSILWEANPRAGLYPSINLDREAYHLSTWNFGLNWRF